MILSSKTKGPDRAAAVADAAEVPVTHLAEEHAELKELVVASCGDAAVVALREILSRTPG